MKEAAQKRKKNIILRIAVIALGVYLLYSLIATQAKISEMKSNLDTRKQEYSEKLIQNEELQKTLDSYGTDEFIERQARSKLGYAYADEHFYIDVSGTD